MSFSTPDAQQASFLRRVSASLGDRYVIAHEIGAGATATVYLARDHKHERQVAVKVLRPELTSTLSADRFEREILIAAGLTHPNILPVHDSGAAEGLLYYVMPFVEGETLAHRMAREGRLPVEEALRLMREIAAALQHAHDRGVVHRDIKPANVLLSGGVAVVADFGLARALQAAPGAMQLTFAGTGLGTPSYMSPEQALGSDDVGANADQYSLGCLLFELLTGRRPFEGGTLQKLLAQHVNEAPPDPRSLRPEIPPAAAHAIMRAMAKDPDERFPSLDAFAAAAAAGDRDITLPWLRRGGPPARTRSRRAVGGALGLVAVLALGWLAWTRRPAYVAAGLDRNLVVIAPFSVIEPELAVWREGLSEVIAHNLDGAGPLRTVAMAVAARGWTGRGDQGATIELGRRTRAASAVSGTLLRSGADSVRLTATVYDVIRDRTLGSIDLRDATVRMDRLTERLTIEVLAKLGQSQQVAEARLASARSVPLPALKAFLQGEYFFRRTAWDSSMVYYQRAVELDSTMSLAYLRMSMVTGWQRLSGDSLSGRFARQASALNRGLAPRESLLVEVQALKVATVHGFNDAAYATHRHQLFATLDAATQRYPDDRELWFTLGSALGQVASDVRGSLAALDRAIAIDSGFAPAYLDAVTLAMALGQAERARGYLTAYLALHPQDVHGDGLRLAARLLDPLVTTEATRSVLDTASSDMLVHAIDVVAYWPDSGETAIRLARLLGNGRRASFARYAAPSFTAFQLAYPLGFRGHLREALEVLRERPEVLSEYSPLAAIFVMMGALPPADAENYFAAARGTSVDRPSALMFMLPWWSTRGDTASLRSTAERAEGVARATVSENAHRYAGYLGGAARAYLALARGDSAAALAGLLALNPDNCLARYCVIERLVSATLLGARGRNAEAMRILDVVPNVYSPLTVRWQFERARIAERLGRRGDAAAGYAYVAAIWRHADAVLQPTVREADAASRRLGAVAKQ